MAAASAARGYSTLVVDLDIQGHSSEYLLCDEYKELEDNTASFFKQHLSFFGSEKDPMEFIYETSFENLFIMPSSQQLASIERDLESKHKIFKLRDALKSLTGQFQRIFMDTPPALDFYRQSALIVAESLLIPFDCDSFSQHGLYNLLETVKEIKSDHNQSLRIKGVVVNQYQARARLPQQLVASLRKRTVTLFWSPFFPPP